MQGQRSVVAPRAMVTSPHALASAAGLRILHAGGNAIEAAIAAASTIAVVYPHMNSIGGDNFWLIFNAKTGDVRALLACGMAGAACTVDAYRRAGYTDEIPRRGPLAANTVPGAVDGWFEAYAYGREAFGGRRGIPELLADAIWYAERGFPVTPSQAHWTRRNVGFDSSRFGGLEAHNGFRETFLKRDGAPYASGERIALPDLAATLRAIAAGGADAFYRGPIAEAIVDFLRKNGGLLDEADFTSYRSRWETPLELKYRAWTLYNTPPPTQGLTSLQILNILQRYDSAALLREPADFYHFMVEATKQAFVDRDAWIADPDFHTAPLDELLSSAHGIRQAAGIHATRAATLAASRPAGGDTVWLGVVDEAGNAVSMIQSIYFDFGSGVIPDGTGVLLQNRGTSFSLDATHPTAIVPGKRPFHTLNPAMALRAGKPELVYGTMGGEGQPQTQAAIAMRILDFGMDVQAAIDAPRLLYGRTWGEATSSLSIESRAGDDVIAELRRRGHNLNVIDAWDERVGHAQAIRIDPITGMRYGGADPRGDGLAMGF
jgi:gamma-glutamyltranspeptidase/glutathione hydrolase